MSAYKNVSRDHRRMRPLREDENCLAQPLSPKAALPPPMGKEDLARKARTTGRGLWRAANAILVIGGLIGYGVQAAGTWIGLDPSARSILTLVASAALLVGGSYYLYKFTAFLDARPRAERLRDPRVERVSALSIEFKAYAKQFYELMHDRTDFGLYRLIEDHAQGTMNLYTQTHLNRYSPTNEDITRFAYQEGREADLAALAHNFEAAIASHGEFIDRFLETYAEAAKAGKGNPKLAGSASVCIENYNHLVRHIRIWQSEFQSVGLGNYHPGYVRLRAPPAA